MRENQELTTMLASWRREGGTMRTIEQHMFLTICSIISEGVAKLLCENGLSNDRRSVEIFQLLQLLEEFGAKLPHPRSCDLGEFQEAIGKITANQLH